MSALYNVILFTFISWRAFVGLPAGPGAALLPNLVDPDVLGRLNGPRAILESLERPGIWSLELRGQAGDLEHVTGQPGQATIFEEAQGWGTLGILAHDYLAGGLFYDLDPGAVLWIRSRTGAQLNTHLYQIERVYIFERLGPDIYQDQTGQRYRELDIYNLAYRSGSPVTLQTCYGYGYWIATLASYEITRGGYNNE